MILKVERYDTSKKKKRKKALKHFQSPEVDYYKALRSSYRLFWAHRSPLRQQALKDAKVGVGKYMCNHCKKLFVKEHIEVDHIEPAGREARDLESLLAYIRNNEQNALQVLCKSCHKIKTKEDNVWIKNQK